MQENTQTQPTTPTRLDEIIQDYSNICAQLGDIEMKIQWKREEEIELINRKSELQKKALALCEESAKERKKLNEKT